MYHKTFIFSNIPNTKNFADGSNDGDNMKQMIRDAIRSYNCELETIRDKYRKKIASILIEHMGLEKSYMDETEAEEHTAKRVTVRKVRKS